MNNLGFTLSYEGNDADVHEIDFYDIAQALFGFQRSLALTTHLVLNGEVITKAPFLEGARIIALPATEGSWRIESKVILISTALYTVGTAPHDTPIGHLISSAYDYVISETLGFHIDYDKSLGQQYAELKSKQKTVLPILEQSQLDSVIEKCESNIIQMHRPITFSETAKSAELVSVIDGKKEPFKHHLNYETYDYVSFTEKSPNTYETVGRISSYNINTYKGRIFIPAERRPISFKLADVARDAASIARITHSLTMNAQDRFKKDGNITCIAYQNLSRTGRLKSLYIVEVKAPTIEN